MIAKSVSNKLLNDDKTSLLMGRWRFPSLSLHGIEGAFSDTGAKTVIPAKVVGKFSLRLVPDQSPEKIGELTETHLKKVFDQVSNTGVSLQIGRDYFHFCKKMH
jgi:acetylornithine deacetylase/succinyl-diaminopimelate desuccinylase-like protein